MFWVSVGAAAGYYAARRGEQALEDARARGLVGNVVLVATTATKVGATATRIAVSVGGAAAARIRPVPETPSDPARSGAPSYLRKGRP